MKLKMNWGSLFEKATPVIFIFASLFNLGQLLKKTIGSSRSKFCPIRVARHHFASNLMLCHPRTQKGSRKILDPFEKRKKAKKQGGVRVLYLFGYKMGFSLLQHTTNNKSVP